MNTNRVSLAAVLILLVTCWAYLPGITAGFVYEDLSNLRGNVTFAPGFLRHLTQVTWWAQIHYTPWPWAFHGLNLVLHLGAGLLVGVLARRLGLSPMASLAAMAVFLVHRIQVEAVAYTSGRADLLATIGVLVACILAAGEWWRLRSILGISLALVVGLLAKEAAVVGLGLVALVVWARGSWYRAPPETRWCCAIAAAGGLLAVSALLGGTVWHRGEGPGAVVTGGRWALLQATAAVHWLTVTAWPWAPQSIDDDIDAASRLNQWLSVCVLGCLTVQAWMIRRRHPLLAMGLAWWLLCLLPRLVVRTPRSYLNAHQLYMASVGVALLAGQLVDHIAECHRIKT